jgi:hypothetical protein
VTGEVTTLNVARAAFVGLEGHRPAHAVDVADGLRRFLPTMFQAMSQQQQKFCAAESSAEGWPSERTKVVAIREQLLLLLTSADPAGVNASS